MQAQTINHVRLLKSPECLPGCIARRTESLMLIADLAIAGFLDKLGDHVAFNENGKFGRPEMSI